MKKGNRRLVKKLLLSQLLICTGLLLVASQTVSSNELTVSDTETTVSVQEDSTGGAESVEVENEASDAETDDGGTESPVTEAETSLRNIVRGKTPTTNSKNLIESGLSTIPAVDIKHPNMATDGSVYASNNDDNNTKIIAGKETGESDNGYSQWDSVYLQYDFGKVAPVSQVNIYRNTYDNAISTFKNVKVELSTSPDFTEETTQVIFGEQDLVETLDTKGQAQVISLSSPFEARYIRIWGRGHYIQNTNSSWAGYSNGVLINELEVLAAMPKDPTVPEEPKKEAINLAQLKKPYFYGKAPTNIEAINDGKYDENYTVQNSVGRDAYLQYEFKRPYNMEKVKVKLAPGRYNSFSIGVDDDYNIYNSEQKLYEAADFEVKEGEVIEVSARAGTKGQYVRFVAEREDGQPVGYSEIEILGWGDSYDEAPPAYQAPSSDYNQLVWSDEFDGDSIDESKWQIIDGMWNHAAIYNRKAVSIKKEGENSYLSIRSTNYPSTEELIKAVGLDRYNDTEMPAKVTWSSGRLESKDKYSFQFGRMAVRAKVNDSKGIWPAIWMLAQDETGHDEIDVLEYLGQSPWEAWTTNHFGILAKNKASHGEPSRNYEAWSQEFHVYEVEWTPEIIKWYIDGKFVFQSDRGKDRDGMHTRPMFPILETQVGDGWVGDVDYTKNMTKQDSEYLIDWVHIYQKEGQDKVYFDNLDGAPADGYHIQPVEKQGKLHSLTHGEQPHENKNHFYYGGQPRYETSRLYAEEGEGENALVYKIQHPNALHLTTYYKTLEDYAVYNPAAWAKEGKSVRKHLVGAESDSIDFTVYSSPDGTNWHKESVSVVDNFVEATPAYARTTFDIRNIRQGTNFVKIVFPKLSKYKYQLSDGSQKEFQASDVQLAKVTFVAPTQPAEPEQPQEPDAPTTLDKELELYHAETGIKVILSKGETNTIVSVGAVHKETGNKQTPAVLANQDYDLYDIELLDKNGRPVKNLKPVQVILPVDEGKKVERVIYLPNSNQEQSLTFNEVAVHENGQSRNTVVFHAEHFSEYGLVYASKKKAEETPKPVPNEQTTTENGSANNTPSGQDIRKTPQTSNAKNKTILPATGEVVWPFSIIGGFLLILAVFFAKSSKKSK